MGKMDLAGVMFFMGKDGLRIENYTPSIPGVYNVNPYTAQL
jgi:hypothetical protein